MKCDKFLEIIPLEDGGIVEMLVLTFLREARYQLSHVPGGIPEELSTSFCPFSNC